MQITRLAEHEKPTRMEIEIRYSAKFEKRGMLHFSDMKQQNPFTAFFLYL